jgi:hypothetical protein
VVPGWDPRGHGDHDGFVSGPAEARRGVRRARARSGAGTWTCACSGADATAGPIAAATIAAGLAGGKAVGCAASGSMAASWDPAGSWGDSPAGLAWAGDVFAFLGLTLGGCWCHTRADTTISSFSAKGAIRHQVRGSAMYRSCELTSSGSRLFSMTGLVVSQVRTPGGRT